MNIRIHRHSRFSILYIVFIILVVVVNQCIYGKQGFGSGLRLTWFWIQQRRINLIRIPDFSKKCPSIIWRFLGHFCIFFLPLIRVLKLKPAWNSDYDCYSMPSVVGITVVILFLTTHQCEGRLKFLWNKLISQLTWMFLN